MSRRVFLGLLAILFSAVIDAQAGLSKTVCFRPGQYQLDSAQMKALDAFLNPFGSRQPGFLKIAGYTDTTGTEAYNDSLSALRAGAVFNYIRSRVHINEKRAYVTSLGESADAYDLHFPTAHAQRRCVDIWFEK